MGLGRSQGLPALTPSLLTKPDALDFRAGPPDWLEVAEKEAIFDLICTKSLKEVSGQFELFFAIFLTLTLPGGLGPLGAIALVGVMSL